MKHYDVFYGKILRFLGEYPRLVLVILSYNWLVTKLMYLLYPLLLVYRHASSQALFAMFGRALVD